MQFIVKPNPSSQLIILRKFSRFNLLYGIAVVVLLSTGFMFGLLWNVDSNCLSSGIQSTRIDFMSPNQDASTKEKFTLIILIMSSPINMDRRNTIRNTWITFIGQRSAKHYFVIGTSGLNNDQLNALKEEQSNNEDLLIFPQIHDSFSNLSMKLLTSLKWFYDKFDFKFLLKVDDDTFVRIDQLFDELNEKDATGLYLGYFNGRASVRRQGKWSENQWFLCDRYLPYALGGGYVISCDLVKYIVTNRDLFQLYKNEDVSLGVWLAPLKINRLHEIRFDTEYQSRGCSNKYIITHKQSISDMKIKYDNILKSGKPCSEEVIYKNPYIYDWVVPPSSCCHRNVNLV